MNSGRPQQQNHGMIIMERDLSRSNVKILSAVCLAGFNPYP